jgi:DNA-binding HxlR family transcriptional regulator
MKLNDFIMGLSKTTLFSNGQNQLAEFSKAISHPARIAILEYLLQVDQCVCGQLVDELPLAQATISQHLSALKSIGLIKGTISGPSVCYCIDKEKWGEAQRTIAYFFNSQPKKMDGCC